MTATATRGRAFHALTVADVESLCDDAVAVTFDVPAALADEFAFRPGQHLTLRHTIDGQDVRRSYSICAPVGTAPRVGVREIDGGLQTVTLTLPAIVTTVLLLTASNVFMTFAWYAASRRVRRAGR